MILENENLFPLQRISWEIDIGFFIPHPSPFLKQSFYRKLF
jgi:hypothetical protein